MKTKTKTKTKTKKPAITFRILSELADPIENEKMVNRAKEIAATCEHLGQVTDKIYSYFCKKICEKCEDCCNALDLEANIDFHGPALPENVQAIDDSYDDFNNAAYWIVSRLDELISNLHPKYCAKERKKVKALKLEFESLQAKQIEKCKALREEHPLWFD